MAARPKSDLPSSLEPFRGFCGSGTLLPVHVSTRSSCQVRASIGRVERESGVFSLTRVSFAALCVRRELRAPSPYGVAVRLVMRGGARLMSQNSSPRRSVRRHAHLVGRWQCFNGSADANGVRHARPQWICVVGALRQCHNARRRLPCRSSTVVRGSSGRTDRGVDRASRCGEVEARRSAAGGNRRRCRQRCVTQHAGPHSGAVQRCVAIPDPLALHTPQAPPPVVLPSFHLTGVPPVQA